MLLADVAAYLNTSLLYVPVETILWGYRKRDFEEVCAEEYHEALNLSVWNIGRKRRKGGRGPHVLHAVVVGPLTMRSWEDGLFREKGGGERSVGRYP